MPVPAYRGTSRPRSGTMSFPRAKRIAANLYARIEAGPGRGARFVAHGGNHGEATSIQDRAPAGATPSSVCKTIVANEVVSIQDASDVAEEPNAEILIDRPAPIFGAENGVIEEIRKRVCHGHARLWLVIVVPPLPGSRFHVGI